MECDKYKQGFIDALEKVAQDFANKGLRSQDEMSACEIQAFLDTRHVHYEECRGAKPLQQTVERLERERDTARKRVELHGLRDTDTNEFLEGYEAACVDILSAITKGRA